MRKGLLKNKKICKDDANFAISMNIFTVDDLRLMLSHLLHWNLVTGGDNKPKLVGDRNSTPAMMIGTSNYSRLRYKLENLLSPKNLP